MHKIIVFVTIILWHSFCGNTFFVTRISWKHIFHDKDFMVFFFWKFFFLFLFFYLRSQNGKLKQWDLSCHTCTGIRSWSWLGANRRSLGPASGFHILFASYGTHLSMGMVVAVVKHIRISMYNILCYINIITYTLRRSIPLHCISSSKAAIQLYKDRSKLTEMKAYSGVSSFFWECNFT